MVDLDDLTEIMNCAYAAKSRLEDIAEANNKPVQMVLHWTAGKYLPIEYLKYTIVR